MIYRGRAFYGNFSTGQVLVEEWSSRLNLETVRPEICRPRGEVDMGRDELAIITSLHLAFN